MEADQKAILQQICHHLEPFNTNGIELKPDTEIATDLSVDSVAMMDLLMELEDEYDISAPINVLAEIRTVGDLAKAVEEMVAAK